MISKLLKHFLLFSLVVFSSFLGAVTTTLDVNGIQYRLSEDQNFVDLKVGQAVPVQNGKCESKKKDWLHMTRVCIQPIVITATKEKGLVQTGGETNREEVLRFEVILLVLAISLMLVAIFCYRFFSTFPSSGIVAIIAFFSTLAAVAPIGEAALVAPAIATVMAAIIAFLAVLSTTNKRNKTTYFLFFGHIILMTFVLYLVV